MLEFWITVLLGFPGFVVSLLDSLRSADRPSRQKFVACREGKILYLTLLSMLEFRLNSCEAR